MTPRSMFKLASLFTFAMVSTARAQEPPSDAGYTAMANAIDLTLFRKQKKP